MSNPLFQQFGNQIMQNREIGQFIANVRQAQQTVKNPRQQVERMLQSGQISQADFNKFSKVANEIIKMM